MERRVLLWTRLVLSLLLLGLLIMFYYSSRGRLVLQNAKSGEIYAEYPVGLGDRFSVGFVHSVNKSPLTDVYEIYPDGIYAEETVYYGFGAGVQTELMDGEQLSFSEDGAMIISGIHKRMAPLQYFVGTVSDHYLNVSGSEVSLRELCGRSARISISYKPEIGWL